MIKQCIIFVTEIQYIVMAVLKIIIMILTIYKHILSNDSIKKNYHTKIFVYPVMIASKIKIYLILNIYTSALSTCNTSKSKINISSFASIQERSGKILNFGKSYAVKPER